MEGSSPNNDYEVRIDGSVGGSVVTGDSRITGHDVWQWDLSSTTEKHRLNMRHFNVTWLNLVRNRLQHNDYLPMQGLRIYTYLI